MFGVQKVDFLVIGAQKCGTSSFYRYLSANLMVRNASQKEIHYFDLFHDKGVKWYHNHFNFSRGCIGGECTPFYLMHPHAPQRARQYNKKLRLVAILRNPAERAWSHYLMNLEAGREALSFEEALDKEQERISTGIDLSDPNSSFLHYSYLTRGRYAEQLNRWLKYFPQSQLLLINYHEFFAHPWQEIQKVYRFLGVAPLYDTPLYHENAGKSSETAPTESAKRLNDYFREPNQQLADKYGIRF